MSKYTVTPWRSQADLLQVRQQLYRLDPHAADLRQHAVGRVIAWKLRGNLPHAVESTALLIDAVLHHEHDGQSGGNSGSPPTDATRNSSFSVRAVYSAAFTRFVTGFCDIGRSKERSLEPSSMLEIARQLDMPAEFVALRHEATHEELPALRRLVLATDAALRWLWNAYWNRLGEEAEVAVATAGATGERRDAQAALLRVEAEARQTLRAFRSTRRDAIRAGRHSRPEHLALIEETASKCVEVCGGDTDRIAAFASVFAKDKLLAPSKRELGSSMEGAYMIWDSLLQSLSRHQRQFLTSLVESLLQATSNGLSLQREEDPEREAICLWLEHIAYDNAWCSGSSTEVASNLRREMMRWCCMYPGYWTQLLGIKLTERGEPEFKLQWEDVLQASRLQALEVERQGDLDASMSDMAVMDGAADGSVDEEAQRESSWNRTDGPGSGSWVRAVMPLRAPIGVVQ